jgi:hypothetical protein
MVMHGTCVQPGTIAAADVNRYMLIYVAGQQLQGQLLLQQQQELLMSAMGLPAWQHLLLLLL